MLQRDMDMGWCLFWMLLNMSKIIARFSSMKSASVLWQFFATIVSSSKESPHLHAD
jgi:hypothetical protein